MSIDLSKYADRYVGLKLSSRETGFGIINSKEGRFYLNDAWLPSFGAIDGGLLWDYLSMVEANEKAKKKGRKVGLYGKFRSYEIAPEHVTAIRDITEEVFMTKDRGVKKVRKFTTSI